jgi:hypothetical protein
MLFALVSDRFQPAPNSEVPESRLHLKVQIFPLEYLGNYALKKDDFFENFVCLIMFQDKNQWSRRKNGAAVGPKLFEFTRYVHRGICHFFPFECDDVIGPIQTHTN